MVAEALAVTAMLLAALAEWFHSRRTRRIGQLAFGSIGRPRRWVHAVPLTLVAATGAVTWGLVMLWQLDPKTHNTNEVDPKQIKHLLIALDVSPSMILDDAGPSRNEARRKRASEVVASLINRLPVREYRVSLVAFYSEAKPLLKESDDFEVLRYIFEDLPTFLGFKPGKTDLFAGLTLAAHTAKPWRPGSATLLVVSDGVSVPGVGMPRLPASIGHTVVVGVGDPYIGTFIDGHQSRQDTANLRQVANRLKGRYCNANIKHIPTDVVAALGSTARDSDTPWSRRELALIAVGAGSSVLALAPWLLHWFGTGWQPRATASPLQLQANRQNRSRSRSLVRSPAVRRHFASTQQATTPYQRDVPEKEKV